MPNSRRRRFSVQHEIASRNADKLKNTGQCSHPEPVSGFKMMHKVNTKPNKKSKAFPNSSKNSSLLEIVTEYDSSSSSVTVKKLSNTTVDMDVTANNSNIELFNLMVAIDQPSVKSIEPTPVQKEIQKKRDTSQTNREGMSRREKLPRPHRVKVRSPKRRMSTSEDFSDIEKRQSVGTSAINWDQETELFTNTATSIVETYEEEVTRRASNHSIEDMCRICHGGELLSSELGPLISACLCRGTVGRIHVKCLERWLTESGKSRCELCGTRYTTRRVHRYGVPRALVMWVLSQNAKQLMVDSLGIMLMSPLAVLAAWLSGRTLSGLMAQDTHITPWPLASTFVLACMTLVCYYCWIVSAATRHALGWWIWYRSQYEVRLQFQNEE